jgi:hypothetical protein
MEWRIFFIGPMGVVKTVVEADGKSYEKISDYKLHLPKLKDYVVNFLKKAGYSVTKGKKFKLTVGGLVDSVTLKRGDDKVTIIEPINLASSAIKTDVFDAIDDSDLIICDLSGNRPAVAYELAFTHALGIEAILVHDLETKADNFYLNQTRTDALDFNPKTISSVQLDRRLNDWLKKRNKRFDSANPLQDFYQAPLPDISAANGLAIGFYDNFARPILENGEIVSREIVLTAKGEKIEKEIVSKIKGFIVLRPENLDLTTVEMKGKMKKLLLKTFPGKVQVGDEKKAFIRIGRAERTFDFAVNGYLIDIPRTMFSLSLSPRLKRTSRKDDLKSNMESVLIGRFFEGVKKYLSKNDSLKERRKLFHYGSMKEIPEIIKTGKSKTWL